MGRLSMRSSNDTHVIVCFKGSSLGVSETGGHNVGNWGTESESRSNLFHPVNSTPAMTWTMKQ